MEKMRMESLNFTEQNTARLAELFPNCITETTDENGKLKKAINFDLLRQMLSADVVEGAETYEFTWVGKKAAIVEANKPIRKTLRPCLEESVNWDNTENLYIEGDNLDVLKLLQESYLGRIKIIYIDPPYNTGNDFLYEDDYKLAYSEFELDIGAVNETGNRMFKNTDSNGRFHSDWCSMLYPRLLLSRNVLSDDGLIFISIDEHESHNLRNICDEIFGAQNFVSNIVWEKRYTRSNNAKLFTTLTEPVLCYAKNINAIATIKEKRNEKADSIYSNPDNDPRGVWTSVSYVNPATRDQRPNLVYPLINPYTGKLVEHPTNAWKYEKATYEQHVKENKLYWGKNGENTYPRLKKFLSEMEGGMVPVDLWNYEDSGSTDLATKDLEALLGRKIFDFPKPKELIIRIISLLVNGDEGKENIILDFFSGSATTAHAVMQLNALDGGHRKYILVQVPEVCSENSEAYKAGYKTICNVGEERIRRAGAKIKEESPLTTQDLDTGFRVFKLDESNMNDVYYAADDYTQNLLTMLESNVKSDRTDLDLFFGCLLEWGLPLSMSYKSEKIEGSTVHTYNDGDLIACFDENIPVTLIKEIARRQPLRAVFRDSSFNGSPAKINVSEIFKMLAPDTRVKVI